MSKTVTIRIDDRVYENFKKHAEAENRSLSNFIESATLNYIREIDFVDDFEMEEILHNDNLINRLKNGSMDARENRGEFVK